jgi:hypothetical protein
MVDGGGTGVALERGVGEVVVEWVAEGAIVNVALDGGDDDGVERTREGEHEQTATAIRTTNIALHE